jgi:imidazolonepropionase-like amidohydrolase
LARRYASVPGEPSGRTGLDLSATLAGVRSAYSAGVRLAAGSGSGLPALGVLRELELYVQAGVPPADALQSATSGAAQMFKMDDAGTVEAGKRADLLILSANPLDDISNLRKARWVVVAGKLYDCDKLWKAAGFAR